MKAEVPPEEGMTTSPIVTGFNTEAEVRDYSGWQDHNAAAAVRTAAMKKITLLIAVDV